MTSVRQRKDSRVDKAIMHIGAGQEGLALAIRRAGGPRAQNVGASHVWRWLHGERRITEEVALWIHRATSGAVSFVEFYPEEAKEIAIAAKRAA